MIKVLLSLVLYNPLEAMVIIGLINALNGIQMSKRDYVKHSYFLGWINLSLMLTPLLFNGHLKFFIDIFMGVLLGFACYFYYRKVLKKKPSKIKVIMSFMLLMISTMFGLFLFNTFSGNIYVGDYGIETFMTIWLEFIANMTVRMIGFIFIYLIRRISNEKSIEKSI